MAEELLWVSRRCPVCGRLIRKGEVGTRGDGEIQTRGWVCSRHGEVHPEAGWNDPPYPEP
jgi:hypothetical protein